MQASGYYDKIKAIQWPLSGTAKAKFGHVISRQRLIRPRSLILVLAWIQYFREVRRQDYHTHIREIDHHYFKMGILIYFPYTSNKHYTYCNYTH